LSLCLPFRAQRQLGDQIVRHSLTYVSFLLADPQAAGGTDAVPASPPRRR
jgi:hypothetical protein